LIAGDHGAAAQAVAVLAALLLGHGRPAPEAGRDRFCEYSCQITGNFDSNTSIYVCMKMVLPLRSMKCGFCKFIPTYEINKSIQNRLLASEQGDKVFAIT
jgi:hypothetical protein